MGMKQSKMVVVRGLAAAVTLLLLGQAGCVGAQEPGRNPEAPLKPASVSAPGGKGKSAPDARTLAFLEALTGNTRYWPAGCDLKVLATGLEAVAGKNGATGMWFQTDGGTVGFPGQHPLKSADPKAIKEWASPFAAWTEATTGIAGFKCPHPPAEVTPERFVADFGEPEKRRRETHETTSSPPVDLMVLSYCGGKLEVAFEGTRLFWMSFDSSLADTLRRVAAGRK